jgi:uncharacterized protein YjiS (DUF1127 family)
MRHGPLDERLRRRRRIARTNHWRRDMSATLSTIIRPRVARSARGSIRRLFNAWMDDVARFFIYRADVKSLRELNDRELRDIGLERHQIEAAVYGFVPLSGRART